VRVYGDLGGLEAGYENQAWRLRACVGEDAPSATWREVPTTTVPNVWERFIAAIRGGPVAQPDFARGAALQRWLDDAVVSDRRRGAPGD